MAKKPTHVRRREGAVKFVAIQRNEPPARERGEPFRLLFELNPCPMWICDENTFEMLAINKAALKLYGWSRKAFRRLTAKDIRPSDEVAKFLRLAVPGKAERWSRISCQPG